MLLLQLGCRRGLPDDSVTPADDDDSSTSDGDDATAPVDPLAPVIGVFNLTNVVQDPTRSYVDFSGAFGTFTSIETDTLAPAAYLSTFEYGADAAYWRSDLGGFPIPAEGAYEVVNLYGYYPWEPLEQTWWDGGPRIGVGNYLTSRLDFEGVIAYQVDDPLSPGAAAWSSGATLSWDNEGGAVVIAASMPDSIPLPDAVVLTSPQEGQTVEAPRAHDLEVSWEPGSDGSYVTVGLIQDGSVAYIARVPDTGQHVVPSAVLSGVHGDGDFEQWQFSEGELELVLGRTLETPLPHPQGTVLFRSREERRATVMLLPDVVIYPGYGQPGQTVAGSLNWYAGSFDASTVIELGVDDGSGGFAPGQVSVSNVQLVDGQPWRVGLSLIVDADAPPGPRTLRITSGSQVVEVPGLFTVLDLQPSDTCQDATSGPSLETGAFSSTTSGLTNDISSGYACIPWSMNGTDAVYRVQMSAGETLLVTANRPAPGDAALALLTDCDAPESAVACADNTFEGETETLVYTASVDGEYYLVVDGYVFSGTGQPAGPFDMQVSLEREVLIPGWLAPGQTRSFELTGESPWPTSVQPGDIDLGNDLVVEAAAVGTPSTALEFQATAHPSVATGPRTVTVDLGPSGNVVEPEALWITGWPAWNSCQEANSATSIEPGTATGYGVQTTSAISSIPCFQWGSTGPDVLLPIDLAPGESLTATVWSEEDAQLYVLSDCSLAESCIPETAADETLEGEAETITEWTPPTPGRYFLVVDLWNSPANPLDPWSYDLTIEVN